MKPMCRDRQLGQLPFGRAAQVLAGDDRPARTSAGRGRRPGSAASICPNPTAPSGPGSRRRSQLQVDSHQHRDRDRVAVELFIDVANPNDRVAIGARLSRWIARVVHRGRATPRARHALVVSQPFSSNLVRHFRNCPSEARRVDHDDSLAGQTLQRSRSGRPASPPVIDAPRQPACRRPRPTRSSDCTRSRRWPLSQKIRLALMAASSAGFSPSLRGRK